MCERQETLPTGASSAVRGPASPPALVECPASARGCDITCGCCAELWNIDMVLKGETEPVLACVEVVKLLLGMGCPLCGWGALGGCRPDEYKTLHIRSLLAYFLSCEQAAGPALLELLSWMLHDITNFMREQAGLDPIAREGDG